MKTTNFILVLALLLSANALFAQKTEVSTDESTITWLGKKIGGQHEGNIQIASGYLEFVDDRIVKGSIQIDMTTITNTDLKDEGYNQKLVGHLKSDDFFGVENYPTAGFMITESTAFQDGVAQVTGEITIKGNTESISFDVMKAENVYSAKVDIDRSKFDVRYGSNSFFDNLGDKAINDIFTLDIELVTK